GGWLGRQRTRPSQLTLPRSASHRCDDSYRGSDCMTVKVFSFETRVEAWLASAEYLVTNGDTLNVILDIKSPEKEGPAGRIATKMLDELYRGENELPMHAVSEPIFPASEYVNRG